MKNEDFFVDRAILKREIFENERGGKHARETDKSRAVRGLDALHSYLLERAAAITGCFDLNERALLLELNV